MNIKVSNLWQCKSSFSSKLIKKLQHNRGKKAHCSTGKNFFPKPIKYLLSLFVNHKTTKQSKKGGAALAAWKTAAVQRTGFFLPFCFISVLFSARDCHSHTDTHTNVRKFIRKRKQISTDCCSFVRCCLRDFDLSTGKNYSMKNRKKNIIKYLSSLKWLGRTCFLGAEWFCVNFYKNLVKDKIRLWEEK